jgi:hypothetical protein
VSLDNGSSIVHCIGQDANLGKGFAKQVNNKFHCKCSIRDQKKLVGEVAIVKVNESQYIFNLVTKPFSGVPPESTDALFDCLIKLREWCEKYGVKHLSMPKIATGLDQTPWRKVLTILNIAFENSDIILDVYSLPKQSAPVQNDNGHLSKRVEQNSKAISSPKTTAKTHEEVQVNVSGKQTKKQGHDLPGANTLRTSPFMSNCGEVHPSTSSSVGAASSGTPKTVQPSSSHDVDVSSPSNPEKGATKGKKRTSRSPKATSKLFTEVQVITSGKHVSKQGSTPTSANFSKMSSFLSHIGGMRQTSFNSGDGSSHASVEQQKGSASSQTNPNDLIGRATTSEDNGTTKEVQVNTSGKQTEIKGINPIDKVNLHKSPFVSTSGGEKPSTSQVVSTESVPLTTRDLNMRLEALMRLREKLQVAKENIHKSVKLPLASNPNSNVNIAESIKKTNQNVDAVLNSLENNIND